MSDNKNVDAIKLITVLQEKLRLREDENSMLQARVLMMEETIQGLTAPVANTELATSELEDEDDV